MPAFSPEIGASTLVGNPDLQVASLLTLVGRTDSVLRILRLEDRDDTPYLYKSLWAYAWDLYTPHQASAQYSLYHFTGYIGQALFPPIVEIS